MYQVCQMLEMILLILFSFLLIGQDCEIRQHIIAKFTEWHAGLQDNGEQGHLVEVLWSNNAEH